MNDLANASNVAEAGKKLHVGFFSDAVPQRNGVGTYYADLAEHLNDRAEVQMFCPRQRYGRWVDPVNLPLPGDATQKISIPNPFELSNRYKALAPAAVVLATPGPYGMLGLRLAQKHKARIIVGFHTNLEKLTGLYWRDSPVRGRCFKFYLECCNRLLFRHASQVLVNSPDMVDAAEKLGAENVGLMGTTIPKHFIDAPVAPLRDELEVVCFAGRLAAEKNLEAIVDAAQRCAGVKFCIVGDGPERALVEAAADSLANFEYLGWLPREQIVQTIDAADMLVLPSHVESFGTIALEALARNRSVLVSEACGITQWPDLSGALFRIGSDETLAQAITRVQNIDILIRRQKAQLGRAAAIQLNQWTVEHWLEVLRTDQTVAS